MGEKLKKGYVEVRVGENAPPAKTTQPAQTTRVAAKQPEKPVALPPVPDMSHKDPELYAKAAEILRTYHESFVELRKHVRQMLIDVLGMAKPAS